MIESELTFSVSVPSRGDSSPVAAAKAPRLLAPSASCRQSSGPAVLLDALAAAAAAVRSLVGEGVGMKDPARIAAPLPAAAPAAPAATGVSTIGALAGLPPGVAGSDPDPCATAASAPGNPTRRPVAAIQARLSK